MPLIKSKSKEALSKNIATEIRAGKPRAQAAAIGYATQKSAGGHMDHETKSRAEHHKQTFHSRRAEQTSDDYHSDVVGSIEHQHDGEDHGAHHAVHHAMRKLKKED
jgi:hypothetical protein